MPLLVGLVALAAWACGGEPAAPVPPPPLPQPAAPDPVPPAADLSAAWAVSTPAAEGFDVSALDRAYANAPAAVPNLRALVVARNGRLVREAYFGPARPDSAQDMRSVTKTVTALLVGLAADRGGLDVDDLMTDWIDHPALRPEHAEIRIRHLLTMTSGMRWSDATDFAPWVNSGQPVGYVLDQAVIAPPGQRFMYNTGGSHVLAVIAEAAVGEGLLDFAQRHLFDPLGITNRRWRTMQDGVPMGGAALSLLATDAAKIGQLLLQGGRSGTEQVVSESWVEAQTGTRVSLGPVVGVLADGGYGFQTWTDAAGAPLGVDAVVLWGYGGQFVWVVPDRQLVVVSQVHWRGVNDSQFQQAAPVATEVVRRVVAAATPIRP